MSSSIAHIAQTQQIDEHLASTEFFLIFLYCPCTQINGLHALVEDALIVTEEYLAIFERKENPTAIVFGLLK